MRRQGEGIAVTAPSLVLGLSLQGDGGKGFAVEKLGHYAPLCADAPPFLDKQDPAEKIGLHVEPIEAVHVLRGVDAAKFNGYRQASKSC
jgi:hypothetical protein